MAKSSITRVGTVTEVRQLASARSWAYCRQSGYAGSDGPYLAAAGLDGYRLNNGAPATLTTTVGALVAKLSADEVLTVNTRRPDDAHGVTEMFAERLYNAVRRTPLVAGTDYAVPTPNPDAIDPAAYLGRARDTWEFTAPEYTTDEARAEAQRIVTAALKEAENRAACGTVENLINAIGFGEFMPPATTDMVVDVPGFGTVEFTVENDRCGEPRTDRIDVKIRNAIGAKIAAMVTDDTIKAAQPVAATATA